MKTITIFLLLFMPVTLLAPSFSVLYIEKAPPPIEISDYEDIWRAVIWVESKGNPLAWNNVGENSKGVAQISWAKVQDFNKATGSNLVHDDVFNPKISRDIFLWHMEQYGVNSIELGIRKWNGAGLKAEQYKDRVLTVLRGKI